MNLYAGCPGRFPHGLLSSAMKIAMDFNNNQKINIISLNNIVGVPVFLVFSWVYARSKIGQHPETLTVYAQCICHKTVREH